MVCLRAEYHPGVKRGEGDMVAKGGGIGAAVLWAALGWAQAGAQVAPVPAPVPAPPGAPAPEAPRTQALNRAYVEIGLLKTPDGGDALYKLIKAHDPDGFAAMVNEMAAKLEWGGVEADLTAIGIAHLAAMRQRLAVHLDRAPAEALRAAMDRYIDILASFTSAKTCANYIYRGAGALSKAQFARQQRQLLAANTALMRALYAGAEQPVARSAPLASDMGDLFKEWVVATDSVAQSQVIARQDPDDPDACAAFLAFFRFLQSAPHDKAERARILVLRALTQ